MEAPSIHRRHAVQVGIEVTKVIIIKNSGRTLAKEIIS